MKAKLNKIHSLLKILDYNILVCKLVYNSCESGSSLCNNKLISARNFVQGHNAMKQHSTMLQGPPNAHQMTMRDRAPTRRAPLLACSLAMSALTGMKSHNQFEEMKSDHELEKLKSHICIIVICLRH